jgi:branched-chain amino acid transport system substrate-binding protein
MKARRGIPAVAALAVVALAAVGCSSNSSSSTGSGSGSSSSSGTASGSNVVDVYSSLPMQGASSAQTIPLVNGIKLALAEANNKAGQFTVNYIEEDDSTAAAGKWDPTQTAADARKAATDPKAVYYIGEFNSGASEVSIPILNQGGVPRSAQPTPTWA